MAQKQDMTIDAFFEALIRKYGVENLTQRNHTEQCYHTNIKLVLVYLKDKAYKRPHKAMKDIPLRNSALRHMPKSTLQRTTRTPSRACSSSR
jgi:hypothetical protein